MLQSIIETYGYAAVLLGTFLEGETVLVLAGFAAHRGYLHLPWVVLAAFCGSLAGDQLFFYLGRRHSSWILARRPAWQERAARVDRLVSRYHTPFILGFRFLYGLRTVSPFALGMSDVPARKFMLLNAAGALVWSVAVGAGGYLFGNILEVFLGEVKKYELIVFAALGLIGLAVWIVHFCFLKKNAACPVAKNK